VRPPPSPSAWADAVEELGTLVDEEARAELAAHLLVARQRDDHVAGGLEPRRD
jgi:hypothetical protein